MIVSRCNLTRCLIADRWVPNRAATPHRKLSRAPLTPFPGGLSKMGVDCKVGVSGPARR